MKTPQPIHFPVDCPWPSPQSDAIYQQAIKKFEQLKQGGYKYFHLLVSYHPYTQGYWIEFEHTHANAMDMILKTYEA